MSRVRWWVPLGGVLFAVAWFATIGDRPLHRADEARYAEIAREMVVTGDWITPRLNGFKYFGKPPLQTWATAVAFKVSGVHEWSARFWTAFTGLLGIAAAAFVATRLHGPAAGLCAAAVLASSLLYLAMGHVSTLDMGLTLFVSAAVFAFALAQRDGVAPRTRRDWMLAAWGSAALAVLSKGPIGIVLPAAAVGAYVLIQRDWGLLKRLHPLAGGALFLAIAAPWFVAVASANAEYLRFFIVDEHLKRFLTTAHARSEPFWYFGPILLLGLAPWTLTAIASVRMAWSADRDRRFRPLRFLLVWAAVVFVFFSVSRSKLPAYIVPILPALAVIGGCWLAAGGRRLIALQASLVAVAGVVGASLAPSLAPARVGTDLPPELTAALVPWLVAAGVALAAGAAAAALLEWRGHRLGGVAALACGGFLFGQLAIAGYASFSPSSSARDSAELVRSRLPDAVPVFMVGGFDPSVLFYLGRTATMVAYERDRSMSVLWKKEQFIPTLGAFAQRWEATPRALAVMGPATYETLVKAGVPMAVVARDPRRVFVEKP